MQMLYDSDSFVVLHLQPDLGLPTLGVVPEVRRLTASHSASD